MFLDNGSTSSRLDPRTKLLILIVTAVFAGRCVTTVPAIICTVILGVLLAFEGKVFSALKGIVLALIFYAIFDGAQTTELSGIFGAVYHGLLLLVRYFCPILMALNLFTKTTGMGELIASFQKMKLPTGFVIPFIVMIRFMPTVNDEWNGIRKAMMFRGIEFNLKNVLTKPALMVEYIMVPLLFSCVALMDELASSAMARGLDSGKNRSSYVEVKMTMADYMVIILFVAFCVVGICI
ncbi:MAG: energy-coupling factor transporter transmembrane protein EcfT [Lachnospiraceae bacterium]|nr:energy-coupling factor transporter transmembrane protein EcfT [Lachnospiraceae bacterium]